MKITKITLYNVPFRYSTQDRIIENVDTKIERWKKDTIVATIDADGNALFDTVAYDITNGFEGSITINSTNRYNYARLETDLYGTKPVYVFLHALKSIESSTGFSYNIKIDVMASFGKELFDKMNGKNVLIDRMHEDRYKVEGANAIINLDNHALLNSDFKVPDTRGMKVIYDGANNPKLPTKMYWYDYPAGTNDKYVTVSIDNTITTADGKVMYAYAFIANTGKPQIWNPSNYAYDDGTRNDILIAPIALNNNTMFQANIIDGYHVNNLRMLEKLQKDKVINLMLLPFKILNRNSSSTEINDTNQLNNYSMNSYVVGFKFSADNMEVTYGADIFDRKKTEYVLYASPLSYCWPKLDYGVSDIGGGHVNYTKFHINNEYNFLTDLVMKSYYKKISKEQFKQVLSTNSIGEFYKIETQLLNQQISPINFIDGAGEITIDIYNAIKSGGEKINIDYIVSEEGYKGKFKISNNQYIETEGNNILSFTSDAGASYLATNGAYVHAQKRAIEEQTRLQKLQGKAGQAGVYGGGLLGGIMSAINPANWVQSNYLRQANEQMDNVSEAEKAKIDAHIQDQEATAPSVRTGDYKSMSNILYSELKYNWNWTMKIPNDHILKKIYYYVQKHGYRIDDWTNFNEDVYNSRVEWNMLTIKQALDYIPQTDYDDSIITEFAARLENGVRIWHKDDFTIDYTKINLEKKLKTWLDS